MSAVFTLLCNLVRVWYGAKRRNKEEMRIFSMLRLLLIMTSFCFHFAEFASRMRWCHLRMHTLHDWNGWGTSIADHQHTHTHRPAYNWISTIHSYCLALRAMSSIVFASSKDGENENWRDDSRRSASRFELDVARLWNEPENRKIKWRWQPLIT